MKLYEMLENTLKKELNFVSDNGEIKKWVIINKAQNFDEELIGLLLEDKQIREKFFFKLKGVTIFNQALFIQFLEQKNYLNDSYTSYKNKVGLTIDGKYIKQRNEVALVWPFKDCVLEGGQSREEDKREEIFFNEILAQDEITQLLEPKVLTNSKIYSSKGEKTFDKFIRNKKGVITDNLIIKGNNLLTLCSLKKEFEGKVKLIYIDPPYNTGGDSFMYNDSFNHSTWLTFMRNRLELSKQLLSPDGCIFISCDDNEQSYLKVLMDEIFGRENFVANIVAQTNPRGRTLDKFLAKTFEYIILFTKNPSKEAIYQIPKGEKALKDYNKEDENGKYRLLELRNRNPMFNRKNRPKLYYPIYIDPKTLNVYLTKKLKYTEEALPLNSKGEEGCWTWGQDKFKKENHLLVGSKTAAGKWRIFRKDYIPKGGAFTKEKTLWVDKNINHENGKEELGKLFGKTPFSFPKSVDLLKKIIQIGTKNNQNHIILDFHAGSGTTAQSVLDLNKEDGGNRQFIMVEQMEYIKDVTRERVKKIINKNNQGSFTYLELKKYNQAFIEQIEEAKDAKALLTIWEQMKAKSFLNYNVDIKKQDEHIEGFKALILKEQKQHLCEILDKNQLYVNLSSLNDKDFRCTDEEKQVTQDFYQLKK